MKAILSRLQRDERVWPAELVLRASGLVSLYACLLVWRWDYCLVAIPPEHEATPQEFAVALLAVVFLSIGLALTLEGPNLLRRVPLPPRALLP